MTWVADTCPITDEPAERRTGHGGDYEEFRCPFCHKFRIAGAALAAIEDYPTDRRLDLLALAREVAGGDEVPAIVSVP